MYFVMYAGRRRIVGQGVVAFSWCGNQARVPHEKTKFQALDHMLVSMGSNIPVPLLQVQVNGKWDPCFQKMWLPITEDLEIICLSYVECKRG